MNEQQRKAELFRDLHAPDGILVLLNAWDVASARLFEGQGARAIGTTSMGIAAAQGYPDGQRIDLARRLQVVSQITRAVSVPVTADMEAGYADTPSGVADTIRRAIDCGIVGINLEDSTGNAQRPLLEADEMAERVAAARAAADSCDVPLVINARTDVFLAAVGRPEDRLADSLARCNRYREAGADCFFVPGGLDRDTIVGLVRGIDGPLNVVANPAISVPVVPTVPELERLGVRRVSVGSGLMRATLGFTQRAAQEVLKRGTYETMAAELRPESAGRSYETATGQDPAD